MAVPITKIKLIQYDNPDINLAFGNLTGIDKICCLSPLELHSIKNAILKSKGILLMFPRLFEYSTEIPQDFIERVFDSIDGTTNEIFILLPFESLEIMVKILKEEIKFRGYYHLQVSPQIFYGKEPCQRAYLIGTKTVSGQLIIIISDYQTETSFDLKKIIPPKDSDEPTLNSKIIFN